jgi:LmbE family N-acetylglucosaminyl deacetylase
MPIRSNQKRPSEMAEPFPSDWHTAVVLVPHPDDPEYGSAAAVAKWTSAGKAVRYVFACRGEAGIAGMAPEETARLREGEQRRAAASVGVGDIDFWDFPDSKIRNSPELRTKIADTLAKLKPDVALTIYGGAEWARECRISVTTGNSQPRSLPPMTA